MSSSPAEACRAAEVRVIPDRVKKAGLTRCFVYTGPSMRPTLRGGQLLYVRPTAQDVAIGDVVVFADSEKGCVVHRVIAVTDEGLVTRGDNNQLDDPAPISPGQVIGRVEMVEAGKRLKTLPGGRRGLWWVRMRKGLQWAERWLRRIIGAPYRVLYSSHWFHPLLQGFIFRYLVVGRFQTPASPVFKIVHGKSMVVRWQPGQERLQVERPYDLFLHPDDLLAMLKRAASSAVDQDAPLV